jgi:Flp pilus assembly protein TadG
MPGRLFHRPKRFLTDQRGAVSVTLVLMLIPLIAALGMGVEGSSWFFIKHAMQNASDSAAMAAASNGCTAVSSSCYSTYSTEAKSVASQFGFKDGQANVTVAPSIVTCPDGTSPCYGVLIQKPVQISLVGLVGFRGNTLVSGQPAVTISASAVAKGSGAARTYCLFSLAAGGGAGISTSGASHANPTGCSMGTNGSTSCTGNGNHPIADYVDAHFTSDSNCAAIRATSNATTVLDTNYRNLATQVPIPNNPCLPTNVRASYSHPITYSADTIMPALVQVCGDVNVTSLVNVTTPANGSVLVIYNGTLNISGTLKTRAGSGLTIIFTGPTVAGLSPSYYPTGNGTLDIAAPDASTSSPWKGVAVYQDPALPAGSGVNITNAGNSPNWNITGLFYAPNAAITLKGDIKQSTNGLACFSLVDDTFVLKGAVSIYNNSQSQCSAAGLAPPTGTVGAHRQALVQ